MKRVLVILSAGVFVLSSCMSTGTSVYQSRAPETRGERAISSNIELVSEVDLDASMLGVFYSRETYKNGDAQTLLFTQRGKGGFGSKAEGSIKDYDLSETASLSVEQARKFLSAIEQFIAMDPKSLAPSKMFNFELYSGTLDMTEGNEKYRPFKDLTFIVICSVTNAGKTFKTVFPITVTNLYGNRMTSYKTFDLTTEQVQKFHDALTAALAKSTPVTAPASSDQPHT
ncbi:MAG: hypothetical protein ABSB63_05395 [Spirochaetia bacterium]|jgi:hypothetical protein